MRQSIELAVGRLRGRIPRLLLPLVVALRFRLAWSRAAVRDNARAQMRFLLERSRPGADLEAAARAYVRCEIERGELRWHEDLITHQDVLGLEHLERARAQGRGVVLSFMHHGRYEGALPSIARHGITSHMVAHDHLLRDDAPVWLQQHIRVAQVGGGTMVGASIGREGMADLLRRGEILTIASDVPGRTPVRFAGRDLVGSFGAALLATSLGAPVVVMTSERGPDGWPRVRLHEPLDPAVFPAPEKLLETMLAIHEEAVLAWPEMTDLPSTRWGTP